MSADSGATVTVRPSGIQFTAAPGQPIMAAAAAAGYRWPTICGGLGDCLVCHVEVLEHAECLSPATEAESRSVRELRARSGTEVRLACQAGVHGDVVVLKRGVRGRRQTSERETNTMMVQPIDSHLMDRTDGRIRLRGGQCADCDDHHFPVAGSCPRCGSSAISVVPLKTTGSLWSWTIQRFPPPSPPYVRRGEEFTAFGLGYVELPGQLIVESLLTESDPARLRIGMAMRLTALEVPTETGETAVTFAFAPAEPGV